MLKTQLAKTFDEGSRTNKTILGHRSTQRSKNGKLWLSQLIFGEYTYEVQYKHCLQVIS
jgi:hypothetical protein